MSRRRRSVSRSGIALFLSLMMLTTGLVLTPASVAQTEPDPISTQTPAPTTPADGPTDAFQAISEANATDESVVIDTYTSATTEILANPDGTFTARIAAGPVRIPDVTSPSGWTPIDTTLEQTPRGDQASSNDRRHDVSPTAAREARRASTSVADPTFHPERRWIGGIQPERLLDEAEGPVVETDPAEGERRPSK